MTTKTKARNGGDRASQKTFDSRNHTAESDPLKGWFSLAANVKQSRNRRQKRGWNRGRK
jgi:hypothetical protein